MHTIKHTIRRSGAYYYNRRVPSRAVQAFGPFVRQWLSTDQEEAQRLAELLTDTLNDIWKADEVTHAVDLKAMLDAVRPRSCTLSDLSAEYLALRKLDPAPVCAAIEALLSVAGNKNIEDYNRQDARAVLTHLKAKGSATGTMRRRIGTLSAIINYGYAEHEIERRNPFSRLMIEGEGDDVQKRGTFSIDQLRAGYRAAFASGSEVKLLMPILGETGCRIAEIVGLRIEDIDLEREAIRIVPHSARRLKTRGSERELPLVGAALDAVRLIVGSRRDGYLLPRYLKEGTIRATHASNALNKWLKREFDGLTAHSLRHTFRDRLRAVECPMELIDQLGGWSSIGSAGSNYGKGYKLTQKRAWLSKVSASVMA